MQLSTLQQGFLQAFLKPDTSASFLKNIQKGGKLSDIERLIIYQDSITECLANALRETYPVCEKLVGNDFFTGMAYTYIENTPSTSPNLFDYGHQFAEFVSHFNPAKTLPYLSDTCRLEWAWHQAYYAPEQATMDFNALAHIPDEHQGEIIFKLPLGSTLLRSDYPIFRIWQANQDDFHNSPMINLTDGCEHLFIWRKDFNTEIECLNEDEWQLLNLLDQKIKFRDICEQGEWSTDIIVLLQKFIQSGWITNFEIKTGAE